MSSKKVLISGASVAGPALAYWLHRYGFEPTLVERAPSARDGGYAIDFRGVAMDVLDRMGILAEVKAYEVGMTGTTLVDGDGRTAGSMPAEAFSGDLEVLKSDLTRILYEHTQDDVEYLFADRITALTEDEAGVQVEFLHGEPRTFDLVIGADGVHSGVRGLVFGPEAEFTRHLGMSGVGFSAENYLGLDHTALLCTTPGQAVYLFSTGDGAAMTASLSFASESAEFDLWDRDRQVAVVREKFAGAGWEVPRLLELLDTAPEPYFASASQIELDTWSQGRVALVGDAACCAAATSGMGTSQALLGAYVLAGELAAANGDHRAAFSAYEKELRDYVGVNQAAGREGAKLFLGDSSPAVFPEPVSVVLKSYSAG